MTNTGLPANPFDNGLPPLPDPDPKHKATDDGGMVTKTSSPVLTLGSQKAWVAGVLGALSAGIAATITANSDNVITMNEWLTVALAVLGTFVVTGSGTWAKSSKVTFKV